mmetsp:Transcript_5446/g.15591  ORF Transcript_5446/g.15591 Transcript_5446/m.15591 type:complete len:207 (+) Transcript_5446:422-1042(+)
MLRICDPVELDTAIEPCPRRATVTDWMVSGISAPTATTHIPKKHVGTSNSSPKRPTTAAMTVENKDTHKKEVTKVTGYSRSPGEPTSQSGHVQRNATTSGWTTVLHAEDRKRGAADTLAFSSASSAEVSASPPPGSGISSKPREVPDASGRLTSAAFCGRGASVCTVTCTTGATGPDGQTFTSRARPRTFVRYHRLTRGEHTTTAR